MKPVIITKILPAFLLTVFLISCEKENKEIYPLTFEKDSYEISLNGTTSIMVRSGNRDYSLSIENPSILEANAVFYSELGMGDILVTGKQKGETTLSVTDNLSKETVRLKIKVTDGYLTVTILNSNHPALTDTINMILVNDEVRTCYFISKNYPEPGIIMTGKYEFSVMRIGETKTCYLILTYASDEKGHFTDAAIAPTPHKFDISGNETSTYTVLASFLNFEWENLAEDQSENSLRSYIQTIMLEMTEVDTDYKISGILLNSNIPEGILN